MANRLDSFIKEIQSCPFCNKRKIGNLVPGEGNPNSKIVFVGEAPGKNEAKTGRPFIGRSGQLLRSTIREVLKLDDIKDVYITSPIKYLPKNGLPAAEDIIHGRIHIKKQLDILKPKIVILLGSTAVQCVLLEKLPIKPNHGKIIKKDLSYFITYHPSAVMRFPHFFKKEFLADFRKIKKELRQ